MADYDGIMLYDPEEGTEATNIAFAGIAEQMIDVEDVDDYADSYTPTEGCTP